MVGKRRRSAGQPRVDDLFYDNPDPETEQDGPGPHGEDGPGRDVADGGTRGEPDGTDAPDDLTGDPSPDEPSQEGAENGYAARAVRGSDGEIADVRGPGRRRGRFGAAGRWARALGIAGLAAALVYGAGSGRIGALDLAAALDRETPDPDGVTQPAGLTMVNDSTLGCAGPALVGLEDPSVPEPDQGVRVAAGSAPPEALPEAVPGSADGAVTVDAIPDGASSEVGARGDVATVSVDGPRWVRGAAEGHLAAGFAATQLGYSFEEQQWGMATAVCGEARDDAWLVAGGDEAGRVERLILANPTGNPVTVTAEVLGAEGPVSVVGGTGIVVPPSGRQVILLDALAPGEERPVVHVTTTGGPVVAALGDRWLEGTIDRGTEVTTPAAPPATSLVIPAVPAPRPDTADVATVRVAAPGSETAVVQLRALTADGPVRLEQGVTNVEPGAVTDIDVTDLPPGTHGIQITADTPVVAAAHVQRRAEADGTGDLAWIPATTQSETLVGAPLATSGDGAIAATLSVTSLEGATVELVTVVDGAVQTREVTVAAASTHTVDLAPQTESVWVLPSEGRVSAAVVSSLEHELGTQVAGLPLPVAPITREVRAVAPWLP